MSYVGNTPTTQNFIAGTDQFTGNGSTTSFTLSRQVNTPNDIQVTIANVVQNPLSYSAGGTVLQISPAVASGVVIYVRYLSTTLQTLATPTATLNGVFYANNQNVAVDTALDPTKNYGSFGPVTINNGINVTIPNSTTWTIT